MLQWDDERAALVTSSLHYFEGDTALRAGRTVFPQGPLAVTDPLVRCLANSNEFLVLCSTIVSR